MERVIQIEEANALRELGAECEGVISEASQISLAARVYVSNVKFGSERSVAVEYRTGRIEAPEDGQVVLRENFPP